MEAQYARQLRKIAYQVADLVRAFPEGDLLAWPELQASLARYSEAIGPWARAAADVMLAEVDRRDLASWAEYARAMKRGLRDEIRNAPTGVAMRGLLADQVRLITSLPIEAGDRVHRWTLEGIADGTRAAEVSRAIQATSSVTAARADEGMWPYNSMPVAQVQQKYGFAITEAWATHLQRAPALARLGQGRDADQSRYAL